MMVERLKHEGTLHSSSDLLKIFVKMGASWSAQVLTLSGPDAFLLLFFLKTWLTSYSLICSAGVRERGVTGGVNTCVERWSASVWQGFKSTIKLIQIFSKLLIRLSAGVWCLVVGDGFQIFPH